MDTGFDFRDRVVLVTGGGSGIGLAAGVSFARAGAHVVLVSRGGADEAVRQLRDEGLSSQGIAADVSVEDEVRSLVESVVERFGRIDVLVNSAAVVGKGGVEDLSVGEWEWMLRNNVTSQFLCCRSVVPVMKRGGRGAIVNLSSIAGRFRSRLSGIHYVTSKAAVLGFTRQLASDVAAHGIRVNAVCPGSTLTPMLASMLDSEQQSALESSIPLGYVAGPEEPAAAILFLASDAASYITGAVLDVNGGQL